MTAALAMLVWVALVLAAYAIIAGPSDSTRGPEGHGASCRADIGRSHQWIWSSVGHGASV